MLVRDGNVQTQPVPRHERRIMFTGVVIADDFLAARRTSVWRGGGIHTASDGLNAGELGYTSNVVEHTLLYVLIQFLELWRGLRDNQSRGDDEGRDGSKRHYQEINAIGAGMEALQTRFCRVI